MSSTEIDTALEIWLNLQKGAILCQTQQSRYLFVYLQYAHELDRAIQDRDVRLVNPQQLSNSSFKITRRTDAISSLDFMTHGAEQRSAQSQLNSYFNEVREKDSVQRMDLKSTLIAQMK